MAQTATGLGMERQSMKGHGTGGACMNNLHTINFWSEKRKIWSDIFESVIW